MAVNLPTGYNRTTAEPIDVLYLASGLVPYANVTAANTAIASGIRYIGQFVNVNYQLYWYANGITNSDLVAFSAGGGNPVAIYDEGNLLTSSVSSIDFTGANVTATTIGNAVTVNIPNENYVGASPATINLGGIAAGQVLSGSTLNQIIEVLLTPYQVPSFSTFTGSFTQYYEVGDSVPTPATFSFTILNSANVTPNSLTINDATAAVPLATSLAVTSPTTSIALGVITNNTQGATNSWNAEIQDTQLTNITSQSYTATWYFKIYYGTDASLTLNSTQVVGLASNLLSGNINGTYNFAANDYKYFAWLDSLGSPTAGNGFRDNFTGFPLSMADITDDPFYSNTQNGWSYGTVTVTNAFLVPAIYRVYRTKYPLGGTLQALIS